MKSRKLDLLVLSTLSCLAFYVQSLAWPLHLGRDGLNYIIYYLDMWSKQPAYQLLMLRRTPVAPILYGIPLTLFGNLFTEVLSAILYCISILCIYSLGMKYSRKVGLIAAILVIFYPAFGSLFHVVASEPPATFLLLLWCALFFNAMAVPTTRKFILLGLICVLATLSRPDSMALLILSISPFVLLSATLREKIQFTTALLGTAVILLLLWSTYNYVRYDDFAVARGEKAQMPLERAFTISHIVHADNGPASADLAKLVSTQLLTKEPYVSYGINAEIFFSQGKERMFWDLVPLSDQYYGWNSDYSQLRKVGIEAVMAHPMPFFWDYIKSAGGMLLFNPEWPVATKFRKESVVPLDEKGLPVPTEGEKIPRSYFWASSSSPDVRALPDPNSIVLQIQDSKIQRQTDELQKKLIRYQEMLPDRDGSVQIAIWLNGISLRYPPPIVWLIAGIVGFFVYPTRQKILLAMFLGTCLVIIFYPMLGFGSIFIMRARFDPLIILFGVVGLADMIKYFVQRNQSRNNGMA
jgi:hypothetical protein